MSDKIKLPHKGKTPIGAFFSPGIAAGGGGAIIYLGHDGKLHIKRVPPSAPVFQGFETVAILIAASEKSNNKKIKQQLRSLAEQIGAEALQALSALAEG